MLSQNFQLDSSVLYVDDEQNNLNAFRAAFRRDFRVYTAINAVDALKLLKKYPDIKVIIADQRMPHITGVEFFEKVRHIYPNKIRIILTGYSDVSAVVDAINKGQVYRFIDKPWSQEMIKNTIRNATEIYDTRKSLHDKNEALQQAYNELDKFVYSVSHDLRSPLMSILGIANLAELDVEDPKSLEYFRSVKLMVDKLDGYIHDIINHYKGSHKEAFADKIEFESIVNDIIESIKYHPSALDVRFEVNVNQDTDFLSNLMNIKTILSNLISNAFKYQRVDEEDKWVKVIVNVNDKEAVIQVVDNGVGIKEEKQKEVFNMFFRDQMDDKGSGLGLYIVQEAVNKIQAKIDLKSTFGEGTEITLVVPNKK
jgi:signal transduction histidine kinase